MFRVFDSFKKIALVSIAKKTIAEIKSLCIFVYSKQRLFVGIEAFSLILDAK